MIRSRRIDPAALDRWLAENLSGKLGASYVHRLLEERKTARGSVWDGLSGYVEEAHEDARRNLRAALGPTLAPFAKPEDDPAFGYPGDLHHSTLMGYFGEVLAGLVAEHKTLHGKRAWAVPAFLFRFHQVAFQKLDARRDLRQQGLDPEPVDAEGAKVTGRTGNDMLAFLPGPDGELAALLVCEAKCFVSHNATKASAAHHQLAGVPRSRCPSGVRELIEILNDYDTKEAKEWCERLRRYYCNPSLRPPRHDVLLYATGDAPKDPARKTWLATDKPDAKYGSKGPLEVVEIHLSDPADLVRTLYRHTR